MSRWVFRSTSIPGLPIQVHHETASDFFKKMYDEGIFEEKETEQYYDEEAKTFLADRYITGTCPVCGNPNAYGDQCERCGSSLSPEHADQSAQYTERCHSGKKKNKALVFSAAEL